MYFKNELVYCQFDICDLRDEKRMMSPHEQRGKSKRG